MHWTHSWPSRTPLKYRVSLLSATVFLVTAFVQSATLGQFTSFGVLENSNTSTSSAFARKVAITRNGAVFVAGTTSPLIRGDESDFGTALDPDLRAEDVFFTKVRLEPATVTKSPVFRLGSSGEDHLHAMLITNDGRFTFLGGRTSGPWRDASNAGQDDLFLIKLNTMSDVPFYDWPSPLILGTMASESVMALAEDPDDNDILYVTGYTSGSLFSAATVPNSVLTDAIIFAISVSNKTILYKRQFGTTSSDYATSLVVSAGRESPLFVSVITELRYGQFALGNFHLYKFSRTLDPLGDMLLRTYSHEVVSSFEAHPMLPDSLFVSGYSWLDEANGYDAFFKRVSQRFDNKSIGSFEVGIDEVGKDEYTQRFGSHDKRNDFISDMVVHPITGRLLASGYTSGEFANSARKVGETAPFIVCVDPVEGSMTGATQLQLTSARARVEIAGIGLHSDGKNLVYAVNDLDEETSRFSVAIGIFEIPSEWMDSIKIAPTPTKQPPSVPSPSPVASNVATQGFSLIKVIPPVAGGVGGVIVLLVIFIILRNYFKQNDTKEFAQRRRQAGETESLSPRRERVVPQKEQVEAHANAGLV